MSNWVRSEIHLGINYALLTITDHNLVRQLGGLMDLRRLLDENNPELIEKVLTDLIGDIRPSIAGSMIVGLNYNHSYRRWELGYIHKNLPKHAQGDPAAEVPLVCIDPRVESAVWGNPDKPVGVVVGVTPDDSVA